MRVLLRQATEVMREAYPLLVLSHPHIHHQVTRDLHTSQPYPLFEVRTDAYDRPVETHGSTRAHAIDPVVWVHGKRLLEKMDMEYDGECVIHRFANAQEMALRQRIEGLVDQPHTGFALFRTDRARPYHWSLPHLRCEYGFILEMFDEKTGKEHELLLGFDRRRRPTYYNYAARRWGDAPITAEEWRIEMGNGLPYMVLNGEGEDFDVSKSKPMREFINPFQDRLDATSRENKLAPASLQVIIDVAYVGSEIDDDTPVSQLPAEDQAARRIPGVVIEGAEVFFQVHHTDRRISGTRKILTYLPLLMNWQTMECVHSKICCALFSRYFSQSCSSQAASPA